MNTPQSPAALAASLVVLGVFACAVDEAETPPEDAAPHFANAVPLSSLDLSNYERLEADELPDAIVSIVGPEGESKPMPLADLVGDGGVLYAPMADLDAGNFVPNVPQAAAPADTIDEELGGDDQPVAACACSFLRTYDVVSGSYQVVTCVQGTGSGEPEEPADPFEFEEQVEMYCYHQTIVTYSEVECSNSCFACGTETCLDERGRLVDRPDVEPSTEAWTPCNPHNDCIPGGSADDDGGRDTLGDPAPI